LPAVKKRSAIAGRPERSHVQVGFSAGPQALTNRVFEWSFPSLGKVILIGHFGRLPGKNRLDFYLKIRPTGTKRPAFAGDL